MSLSKKPVFFQPLLPRFDDNFFIPIAFMEHLKEANLEKAVLTSSAGKLWPVKINGRRFEDGWKAFCRHHELIVGEFLVFRLEPDMVFHVVVFGHSTCERKCPVFSIKEERTEIPPQMEEEEEEDTPAKPFSPEKKPNNKEQCANGGSSVPQCSYFDVELTDYSAKLCRVRIPVNFKKLHGLTNRHCEMTIEDEKGRFWPADLSYSEYNNHAFIGRGWTNCRSANGLRAGHSLRFELVRNGKIPSFKIKKMKSNKKKQCAKVCSSVPKGPYFDAELTAYSAKRPLHVPMEFAIRHGLNNRRREMIIEDENGRSWPTALGYKESDQRVFIGGGWAICCSANELKAGDSLRFELIKNGKTPSLKMSRLNAKPEVTEDLNCDEARGSSSSTRHSNSNATLKASYPRKCKLKIPKEEEPKDPGFDKPEKEKRTSVKVEVCPSDSGLRPPFFAKKLSSCTISLYKLYIPMKFAKLHHLDAICSKIILIDQKGRSWPAKVVYEKSYNHVYIKDGWKEFTSGNEIKPGDSLVFEIIGTGKRPVLKVFDVKQGTERYRQYFREENT
ncbi:B3 domain-containing protein REM17-like [Mercurialis annua]|uniref:B3 domain-containing protein REM17-like n=1 Tax=Mercurialis annua TaxID=3986 RepID=UPI0021610395|nr:B3 domain-containing protein REM17-like [Mercurialis annua]